MEEILDRVETLDNVQLRAELLKHGERVGPVTASTRKVFVSRLAKKLYAVDHPGCHAKKAAILVGTEDIGQDQVRTLVPSDEQQDQGVVAPEEFEDGKLQTGQSNKETHPTVYYLVILGDSVTVSKGHRVFTEKTEALAFMKKNTGARLKLFPNLSDVKQFCAQASNNNQEISAASSKLKVSDDLSPSLPVDGEKSAFKGPKIQELVQFRKLLEKGELETVKQTVWANPRYLISSADTPVILHEGMRHNALHIAAKCNQQGVAGLVLETVEDPEFTKLLYSSSHDTDLSRQRRIAYLVDLYLNSPDKGSGESPLHIACKMGFPAVVQELIMHSATDKDMVNKFGERPEDIICSRSKGDVSPGAKEKIRELLKGLCLVPLLRSEDNITVPVVGTPCSPDEKTKRRGARQSTPHSPRDPRLTLSAYAGPMSPSKAQEFHRQWSNPRFLKQTLDAGEITARRADPEKGYERIGRKLARELHVPWTEYWQFLDAFADFSCTDGLQKLERHLRQQQALLMIAEAMSAGSPTDSELEESVTESSAEDSEEAYYSCDEGSVEESRPVQSSSSNPVPQHSVCDDPDSEGCSVNGEHEHDVFVDSHEPEDFFDLSGGTSQKYLFGQRLLLTRTSDSSGKVEKTKERKTTETVDDVSKTQTKSRSGFRGHWMYRDAYGSGEDECKASEMSESSDSTKSFDTSCSTDVDVGLTHHDDDRKKEQEYGCPESADSDRMHTGIKPGSADDHDKSFNTVMTELSEDLEFKLIFSPEGKVVRSQKRHCAADVGVCLGQKLLGTGHVDVKKGQPALEVMIKSPQDGNSFLADVLVHFAPLASDSIDGDSDMSLDDVHVQATKNVFLDVKVVTKNDPVHRCVRRMVHPTLVTVGLLEEDGVNLSGKHVRCVTARLARTKRKRKSAQTPCFVYGSRPSKTDLDVLRAMCDCKVDSSSFPLVQSWLSLVTTTQKEGGESWPSPSRLRHQQRLSQLQCQATPGSPHPISPLVQGGAVTSTPVSRSSIRCNRDLSPERLPRSTPRAWLFKSPT